ncbi:hypothetical protein BDZ90DRAFT_262053 [Jaminaea rosea]|uniref:Uncharacterized protein n=1 Tax=Jaminaea rosea TaxID=1569628 RepID=A0A316UKM7_9BASI|nr:hypothetical protein BDZ90DRAFT_262053 [Jaminaea rosea]PWN25852.1 hypothetical protein BDZ90DRAFT_262053 [Jaminaea rosea]
MVRIQSFLFATTTALVVLLLSGTEIAQAAIIPNDHPVPKRSDAAPSTRDQSSSFLPFGPGSLPPLSKRTKRSYLSSWFSLQSDPQDPNNNPALDSSSDSVEFSSSGSLNLLRSKKEELLNQAQEAAQEAEAEELVGGKLAAAAEGVDEDDEEAARVEGGGMVGAWWQSQRRRQRESRMWKLEEQKPAAKGKKRLSGWSGL